MLSTLLRGAAAGILLSAASLAHAADAVTVHVRVTAETLELHAESDTLDAQALDALSATLTRAEPDVLADFSRALHAIKKKHADSERLILAPEVPLTYPELTALMDAARLMTISARRGGDAQTSLVLFPEVVLEGLVVATDTTP